jgi:putative ABC transport system ATP-binding protein
MVRNRSSRLLEAREVQAGLSGGRRIHASLALDRGGAIQVSGPSGCGKTTLLRMLARLEPREGGELLFRGEPAEVIRPALWRRQVVYLAQHPVMLEGSVKENLTAGFRTSLAQTPDPDWEASARELLGALLLDPNEELLEQGAGTLSGGEAARVALCRALLIRPAVILADEPTAALDSEGAQALVGVFRRWLDEGGALVLVAHDPAPWEGLQRGALSLEPCLAGAGEP